MFDATLNQSLHSAQFMGIISALRTGDPTIDMVLAFLIPFLIREVLKEVPAVWRFVVSFFESGKEEQVYTRTIEYCSSEDSNKQNSINYETTSQNAQLVRAIQLYMHSNCKLHLKDADIDLTSIKDPSKNATQQRLMGINVAPSSPVGILQSCQFVEHPVLDSWHSVGSFAGSEVHVRTSNTQTNGNNENNGKNQDGGGRKNASQKNDSFTTVQISLKSRGGPAPIRKFLQMALDWYIVELKKLDDKDRYFFDVQPTNFRAGGNNGSPTFKAFKLGDEKTFDTLFSQQSQKLLKIVNQFQVKEGKYGVQGYPYKLGLLLSGPPGTGKTSLIKALAHYTGRHIVNVPLSRITSNTQLTNVFFNKRYMTGDNGIPLQLDFSKVIFVLEDVDCSTDVVKRRTSKSKKKSKKSNVPSPTLAEAGTGTAAMGVGMSSFASDRPSFIPTDSLDLSGLLNVLDGVVETPGRIVVLTTNHPEVLDPALIRPGRIDKQLVLGPMLASDAIQMIEHYYQTKLTQVEKDHINALLGEDGCGLELTPAKMEQLAMEQDTVKELIDALERIDSGDSNNSVSMTNPSTDEEKEDESDEEESEVDVPVLLPQAVSERERKLEEENLGLKGLLMELDQADY